MANAPSHQFLHLHHATKAGGVIVKWPQISSIESADDVGSEIWMHERHQPIRVRETPAQVFAMIVAFDPPPKEDPT
jgi:hypothetical protein